MSTTLLTVNLQEDDNVHFIPADIQYEGQANVSAYFKTSIKSDTSEKDMCASLRGRPLDGKIFDVPTGYTGVILTEARRPFTDDEERNLTANQSFKTFKYWNLDLKPSEEDKLSQAMKWIDVAKALHEPVSSSDSQAPLKSEVSM